MENENIIPEEQNTEATVTENETFTRDEVLAMIQSESDKRVTQALKTQAAKFEKKMTEAEKLRDMDETQQEHYKLTQRIEELEEINKQFELAENKASLSKAMSDRGLPLDFVDYLVTNDATEMMDKLTTFEKAFKAAVADEVTRRIGGRTPTRGTTTQNGLSKDDFRKMSLKQRAELYKTNPALYKELSN